MILTLLLSALGLATAIFTLALGVAAWRGRPTWPSPEATALGAVVNFFDTLGIGCFAPTTAYLKFRRLVPDELIPATMMAGMALPAAAEGFIFINGVKVDPLLMVLAIAASVAGSFAGVLLSARLPVGPIRLSMGVGLLVAAALYALSNLGLMPPGGTATTLPPLLAGVVIAASFGFGVLINLGIGNFAPTLVLVSLLGMDPRAAFPIMMGSSALLLLTSGVKILASRPLKLSLVVGLALGGTPAVVVAALIVKSLPLAQLRWGVVAVVTYAGAVMLHAAVRGRGSAAQAVADEARAELTS
jgi:uncharacterized membrane protein YfcA